MDAELRQDPTSGRWVVVRHPRRGATADEPGAVCPFCPGNETLTPSEIVAYRPAGSRPNEPGWQVRVFAERDPYFTIEEELVREGVGMFDRVSPRGASEILVEDPGHQVTVPDMDESQLGRVLWMYRDRIQDLKRDSRIRSIVVLRRHGKAGARLHHPYSRILAAPVVFDDLRSELAQAREYYGYKYRCVYCDTVREELASRDRVVRVTPQFVAFVPYAARVPFELRVLPRRHGCAYEEITTEQVADLAGMLRDVLGTLRKVLADPPYEMVLHTAPNLLAKVLPGEWDTVAKDYHWHVEIIPHPERRMSVGGIAVNATFPEAAARVLRDDGRAGHQSPSRS